MWKGKLLGIKERTSEMQFTSRSLKTRLLELLMDNRETLKSRVHAQIWGAQPPKMNSNFNKGLHPLSPPRNHHCVYVALERIFWSLFQIWKILYCLKSQFLVQVQFCLACQCFDFLIFMFIACFFCYPFFNCLILMFTSFYFAMSLL